MPHQSRASRRFLCFGWCAGWAAAALVGGAGCADGLDAVDREIERRLEIRAARLSPESRSPVIIDRGLPDQSRDPSDRSRELAEEPPTVDPAASALSFSPADEARDVAARLDAYAADAAGGNAEPPLPLTLFDALATAQRSGREYLAAEEDYLLAAIGLLIERHLWGPRLFNDTSARISGVGEDGRFESAVRVINQLRATQRLPYGGSAEAAWVWDATEQLREQASGRYRQSSSLVGSFEVPLLRGAGMIAREDLIQAERDLVYAARDFERFRREYAVALANDYFDLLEQQARILNQEAQLDGFLRLEESTAARVAAGRLSEFDTAIASNRVLGARATLAGLRERYILAVDRFKIRLGLPPNRPVSILPLRIEIPEPEISQQEATARALEYRLDLQNLRDRTEDARRAVANARNQLLPDLNLDAGATIPTDGDTREGGVMFDTDDTEYRAGVEMSLPLDRKIERLGVRRAQIRLERARRDLDERKDQIGVFVRQAVRNVDLARFQLTLAERQVEINKRRLEEQELKEDQIDPQQIVDTRIDLLDSENERDSALTNLRNAVLRYLLESDQLRVGRDGRFIDPRNPTGAGSPPPPAATPEPERGGANPGASYREVPAGAAPSP